MPRVSETGRKWWILAAMGLAGGLILLDETVLGVALPTIRRDLGMGEVASHWVINAYFLVFAGFSAAGGKVGDLFGLKRTVILSVTLFGVASLAAGFAENTAWLITARAIQGLGSAAIFPATLAMVTNAFPKEERGGAIGMLVGIAAAFLLAGPVVGGFFTELLSWRWIFWINLLCVVPVVAIVWAVWTDPPKDEAKPRIAMGELITLVAGLGLLVFAIMQSADWGWHSPVILGGLAGGLVLLAAFVLIERRRDAPLIDVRLFQNPTFSACIFQVFAGQYSKVVVVVFAALYLQHILKMSPLTAGLALLVAVIGTPAMSSPSGKMADKFGARGPCLIGTAVAAAGMIWIGLAFAFQSYPMLVPGLLLWGCAVPLCFIPAQRAIMSAVPANAQGQASGITATIRLLASTIGMAVSSVILATTGSYRAVFLVSGGVLAIAMLVGWLVIERRSEAIPEASGDG